MKTQKILFIAVSAFIALSAVAVIMVSMMAFSNPQAGMNFSRVRCYHLAPSGHKSIR